jgi:hypothetical protein
MYDESGTQLWGKQYNYDGTYQWSNFTGQELFTTPLPIENVDTILIRAEGDDPGFWAGYYGPEFNVSASSFTLIYSANPCYPDPLYSPTCEGYAEAYANKLLEEQMAAQQEAALIIPEVQSVVQTTPTETFSSPAITSQVQLGGTGDTGSDSGDTGSIASQQTTDSEESRDDKKEKLDLAKSLDPANSFNISSVSGAPSSMEDPAASGVVESAEATSIGIAQENLTSQLNEISTTSATSSATQTSQSAQQNEQRRDQIKKQLTEERANEIAQSNQSAESMDEQSQQQDEQLALMSFVPGFDAYKTSLPGGYYPDADFYKPQQLPNAKQGLRNGLAQQLLHEQMVEMQYDR